MDALAPLAGRLLVDPLHPWPPGSPLRPASPHEEAEAAARLQHAAILFLTNVMNSPDVRARVLATAPGFWEVLAGRYRRERAAGVMPRDTPHCAMLLVGTLLGHPPLQRQAADLIIDDAIDWVFADFRPPLGNQPGDLRCHSALIAIAPLAFPELGGSYVQKMVNAGVVGRAYRLAFESPELPDYVQHAAQRALHNLASQAAEEFLSMAPRGFARTGGIGKLPPLVQGLLDNLAPFQPSKSFMAFQCLFHLSCHIAATVNAELALALLEAGALPAMVRAADKLIDDEETGQVAVVSGRSDRSVIRARLGQQAMRAVLETLACAQENAALLQRGVERPWQDSRWRAQRAALAPLLRKYLLHPSALVRSSARGALYMLGCLKEKQGSQVPLESTRLALDADKLRLLARLIEAVSEDPVDPDSLPVEPGADFNFSNMASFGELRMCDACGGHNHFRMLTGQPKIRLSLCAGCRQRQFCSKECQRRLWRSGHKQFCQAAQAAGAAAGAGAAGPRSAATAGAQALGAAEADYARWGVRALKEHLAERGVDCSHCIEKSQLVELCHRNP